MPTVTVRNLSERLYERLKERAEGNRRSLNNEVLHLLEEALLPRGLDTESLIDEAEAAEAWFDEPLPDLIDEGIKTGRKYDSGVPENVVRETSRKSRSGKRKNDR